MSKKTVNMALNLDCCFVSGSYLSGLLSLVINNHNLWDAALGNIAFYTPGTL